MTIARLATLPRVVSQGRSNGQGKPSRDKENRTESSHVAALHAKHEGLERRIQEEMNRPAPDSSMIQALKKRKLKIKEELSFT